MYQTNQTQITLKVDEKLKRQAMQKAKKEGITLKALLVMAMKGYLNNDLIFGLRPKEEASQFTLDAIRDAEKDLENGQVQTFQNANEMIKHLRHISNT